MKTSPQNRDAAILTGVGVAAAAALAGNLIYRRLRSTGREREQKRAAQRHRQSLPPDARAPQPGDILLFFRPHRLLDYMIEIATGSHYYHAALAAEKPGMVFEARPKGVNYYPIGERAGEYVVVPAPGGRDCGQKALRWAETQKGDPFDHEDLYVIGLERLFRFWRINYGRPGRFSCAELVDTAYQKGAGIDLVKERRPSEVAPADLARWLPTEKG